MNIIILGPPGAGKGTQSKLISQQLSMLHISTGDMLRQAIAQQSAIGQIAEQYINEGNLIPDDVMVKLLLDKINQHNNQSVIIDGFPRNLHQAEVLAESEFVVDLVIELYSEDEDIIERLSGRRVHLASGRTYHSKFKPPLVDGIDDLTGEALVQRDDDNIRVISQRLKLYHSMIRPIRDFYQNSPVTYKRLQASGSVASVQQCFVEMLQAN